MKRTTLFSSLLTAALGLVMAGPASATDFTWVGGGSIGGENDWRVNANWNPSGYPGTGDTATIPNVTHDPVIDQQDEAVATLTIQNGGKLTVSGKKLEIEGSAGLDIDSGGRLVINATNGLVELEGGGTHDIDGIIEMDADGVLDVQAGTLDMNSANTHPIGGEIWLSHVDGSTLKVSAATTLAVNGSDKGSVVGQDADASIDIADTITLTSSIFVKGMMAVQEVSGTGAFVNNGTVLANAAGTLSLDANVTLTGSGEFQATTSSSAVLVFNVSATGLSGEFTVSDCAKLELLGAGVDVYTTGDFIRTANDYKVFTPASGTDCFKWLLGSPSEDSICDDDDCS